jgi:hypothetical protein
MLRIGLLVMGEMARRDETRRDETGAELQANSVREHIVFKRSDVTRPERSPQRKLNCRSGGKRNIARQEHRVRSKLWNLIPACGR